MSFNSNNVPSFLEDDFELFSENIGFYIDNESPNKLEDYLTSLSVELKNNHLIFVGMIDQLAMAMYQIVMIDINHTFLTGIKIIPKIEEVRDSIRIHDDYRDILLKISDEHAEEYMKALLCIYYHKYQTVNEDDLENTLH